MYAGKILKNLDALEQEQRAQTALQNMKDLQTASFESAARYANAIIFAGYAGIFATWTITKEYLDFFLSGIVGILLVVSIGAFVSFEVYKMVKMVILQDIFVRSTHGAKTAEQIIIAHTKLENDTKVMHQNMMRTWLLCFLTSALTGCAAGGILLWSLIDSVIGGKL